MLNICMLETQRPAVSFAKLKEFEKDKLLV